MLRCDILSCILVRMHRLSCTLVCTRPLSFAIVCRTSFTPTPSEPHGLLCTMQVDVEGWEFAVFRGAQALLPRVRNIVMEYSPGVLWICFLARQAPCFVSVVIFVLTTCLHHDGVFARQLDRHAVAAWQRPHVDVFELKTGSCSM